MIQQEQKRDLRNSKGLVIAVVKDKVKRGLNLYQSDGSLWKSIFFDGNLRKNIVFVYPYAKDIDAHLLAFDCIGVKDGFYKVVINEKTQETKYIKMSDKAFVFVSWGNYIVKNICCVGFQPIINPLRVNPSTNSEHIPYTKDEFYLPVKTQGNWLQVRWGEEKKWNYGWIQWKRDNYLVLELFTQA
ncbi:hypothetical protein GCM10027049_08340 [Mucilaginibacter puniceus]